MATYRYLRWTITETTGASNSAQIAEFNVLSGGSPVSWPSGTTCTNPGGDNPFGEEPEYLIDGDSGTKLLDFDSWSGGSGSTVVKIDCGSGNSVTFGAYRYTTANDEPDRDPITWTLEGSNNDSDWDLLDTQTGVTITSSRFTDTQTFTIVTVSPITSTITNAFSIIGSATGKGTLASTVANTIGVVGVLTGKGTLLSTSAITISVTSTLSSGASLVSAPALVTAVTGTLTGKGALASVISTVFGATSTLAGRGSLSSSIPVISAVVSTFTAKGALASTITISLTTSGSATGKGILVSTVSMSSAVTGTFVAVGTLTSTISIVVSAVSTLTGPGPLTSTISIALAASGVLADEAAAQFGRPTADTSIGSWTDELGGTSNLYTHVDETAANDADFVKSEVVPSNSPIVFKLTNLIDPGSSIDHTINYRYGKGGGAKQINLTHQIRESYINEGSPGTLIAEWSNVNVPLGFVDGSYTLSAAQANSISNYSSLYYRGVANAP